MYRFSTPWTLQSVSTTPDSGLVDIRVVPMLWALLLNFLSSGCARKSKSALERWRVPSPDCYMRCLNWFTKVRIVW